MKNELLAPSNLIQFNGEAGIIRQIDDKKAFVEFRHRKCDVSRDDMEGVEITAEWLEKLGFVHNDHDGDCHYEKIFSGFLFEFLLNDNEVVLLHIIEVHITGGSVHCMSLSHIRHVHQLQNLVYAMTGEELEIKV